MRVNTLLGVVFIFLAGLSCTEEHTIPKPQAMLRLDFPKPEMQSDSAPYFSFKHNKMAKITKRKNAVELRYPGLKAAIFMSYRKVNGDIDRLTVDAQKLSYEHAVKADGIRPRAYEDPINKVYGAFFEVQGDAASQAQFYLTDSLNHFVTGSLYFDRKPNYDSIYPAAIYLQQDMGRIMETLRWK